MSEQFTVISAVQQGGGEVRAITFPPTRESLDVLIAGTKRSIESGWADPSAGVTLLLAELLKHALDRLDHLNEAARPW